MVFVARKAEVVPGLLHVEAELSVLSQVQILIRCLLVQERLGEVVVADLHRHLNEELSSFPVVAQVL